MQLTNEFKIVTAVKYQSPNICITDANAVEYDLNFAPLCRFFLPNIPASYFKISATKSR